MHHATYITLHFINIKNLKYAYKQDGSKTISGDSSLSLRRDVAVTYI